MKNHSKLSNFVHNLVFFLRLERILVYLTILFPIFIKAFPQSSKYKKNTFKKCVRDKVTFFLDVSDYMQWYVYSNIKDNSWIHIFNCFKGNKKLIIFDIGANIGCFSLKLAKKCSDKNKEIKVYSFEPNKEIFKIFKKNISFNKTIAKKIVPIDMAVGNLNKKVNFCTKESNSGGSKVIDSKSIKGLKRNNLIVEQITLDYFVQKKNIEYVDAIKIDVEGYEPFVLDGCINTIEKFKPLLYIEMSPEWFKNLGRSSHEIIDLLKSNGYSIFIDEVDNIRPINYYEVLSIKNQFNILAIHDN